MIVYISPTKTMKPTNLDCCKSLPIYVEKSKQLLEYLRTLTVEEIATIMKIKESMAKAVVNDFSSLCFDQKGTHAIATYQGLSFKYMKLEDFNQEDYAFANTYIRILSGLYGVVKPLDSIYPYRLEMQTKFEGNTYQTLYDFWGQDLHKSFLTSDRRVLVNLASKEYSKCILPYISKEDLHITVQFYVRKNNQLKSIATHAKMARGQMINYIVKNRVTNPLELKKFQGDGWEFNQECSTESEYIFVKE